MKKAAQTGGFVFMACKRNREYIPYFVLALKYIQYTGSLYIDRKKYDIFYRAE